MWRFSLFVRNIASLINLFCNFFEKKSKVSPEQFVDSTVSLVSRTGRHKQRYDEDKGRLVAGCIPYRYKEGREPSSTNGTCIEDLEILVISAQKGQGVLFPKGGWEKDETMEEAALRETIEEAGVLGIVECKLGAWKYYSKRGCIMHEGYMFPLLVKQQLEDWPEKHNRQRKWVTVEEARKFCQREWMREALEALVQRQSQLQQQNVQRD